MTTFIEGIGTANPPYSKSQFDACEFLKQVEGMPEPVRARLDAIHNRSAIERRFTCIEDYNLTPPEFQFFPRNASLSPQPTTAERNALYKLWAPRIAETACRAAFQSSNCDPSTISHLIVVTCTGFYSPGVDVHLVRSLGLRPDVDRTIVGFMGCNAAFNALKIANAICSADRTAKVLVVCVELCTLHFQPVTSIETAVVSALFADGAAAAVLTAGEPTDRMSGLSIVDSMSLLDDNSLGDMTWDIGNTGFNMTLSARVPAIIERRLPAFVEKLAARNGLQPSAIDFWAIHPGGRQVLDRAASCLNLPDFALVDSYDVLRSYGNMSSATILFILQRIAKSDSATGYGMALAFGPGLTIEGCLLRRD